MYIIKTLRLTIKHKSASRLSIIIIYTLISIIIIIIRVREGRVLQRISIVSFSPLYYYYTTGKYDDMYNHNVIITISINDAHTGGESSRGPQKYKTNYSVQPHSLLMWPEIIIIIVVKI